MRTRIQFLLFLFSITTFTFGKEGDKLGEIVGTVVQAETQEPIIGANIVIVGTTQGTTSNTEGNFSIKNVAIGTCQVRVSSIGFETRVITDVVVNNTKPAELKVSLRETGLELETTEVVATYFSKNSDAPLSTQTQSNEEIRRLPGGLEDVVRAISILPGVAQVQAGRNDLIVRGGAPSENLYVIDNLEIPNINHFGTQGASGGPLSFINLDYVRGTQFSSGGFGVRYGDKLSSVLTLDLQDGRKDKLGGKLTISASQFGVNLEGPINEQNSFLFSARRSYLDFIFKAAGFSFVPEYWDFLGKSSFKLDSKNSISFVGIGVLDNVKYFNSTSEKRFDNSRVLGSDQRQFIFGATWKHLAPSGYTNVTLGQTNVDYDYVQRDTVLQPVFSNTSFEYETSLRGEMVMQVGEHSELTFGAIGKIVNFSSSMFLRQFLTDYGQNISVNAQYDTMALKAGFYTQFSRSIAPWKFTFGLRSDYFNLLEKNIVLSPRFSVSYKFSSSTSVTASVGKYFQSPSYIWLVSNPANRNLRFINVNQYILGVEQTMRSDTKISIEGYVKKYSDYPASIKQPFLVLANSGAGFGGREESFASFGVDSLASKGNGEARGIEFFIQKKLSEIPCYGTFGISYSQSKFTALDGKERASSFDQRWIINIGGGYIFDEAWEVGTKFRFATGRPYTPYASSGTKNIDLYNTVRVGNNHSLDVRIDRRWMMKNWMLVTYIDVQNVYNKKPLDVPRFNERTMRVEQNDAIGILPSIGISAEF